MPSVPVSTAELERCADAIAQGHLAEAAANCRELAEHEPASARAWHESARLLDALARGEPVVAFMQVYACGLDHALHDRLIEALIDALARADQPLLALAAITWLRDSRLGEAERARLARELDPLLARDERALAHAVASRVLDHHHAQPSLASDDPLALQACAKALVELERPREALALLVRALAREPKDYVTRIREIEVLRALGETTLRRERLDALVVEFPERAEPPWLIARELAASSSAADRAEAARYFGLAHAREFAEQLVLDHAALLEQLADHAGAVALLEASHARADLDDWRESFARELARIHRRAGELAAADRWARVVEQQVTVRERGYAGMAIALMVVMLAVVLAALTLLATQ